MKLMALGLVPLPRGPSATRLPAPCSAKSRIRQEVRAGSKVTIVVAVQAALFRCRVSSAVTKKQQCSF